MWFTIEEEKPDIGTVIFKADDYYERLQHITGMWNDNRYLYYEMTHFTDESSSEEQDTKKEFSVSDITDVPVLLAYLEAANMKGILPTEMVDFMWDLHQLYVKKMAEYGHAIRWMSKKDYTILENREKWLKLVKVVEERQLLNSRAEKELKKRKRKLKPAEIKLLKGVDSSTRRGKRQTKSKANRQDKSKGKTKSKKKGSKMARKRDRSRKRKTQWQLFMRNRLKHPTNWDFGQTVLFDRKQVRLAGKHMEFTRFYHKLSRALRFSKYEPVDWKAITLAEIDKHRQLNDCWMAIKGRVYDVTPYLKKHPGGSQLIMQGAGIDATSLFVSVHPYVVFYEHLAGMQIGRLPFYQEHFHTEWEPPATFDIFRTLKEWVFRPRIPCAKFQPVTTFKQFDTYYIYTVNFPKDLISREDDWTITITNGVQVTIIKHIDTPVVYYGGFDLLSKVMDDTAYRIFSDDYNSLRLEIKKPYKVHVPNPMKDKRQDDGFFLSCYSLKDMYRATVVERTSITPGVKLYGICVGMNKVIGCPVGCYVNIRLQDETRPYTPVCLPDEFEKPFKEESGGFQTLFFIIKEYKDGDFTSMLHHMPITSIVQGVDIFVSNAMGNFQTKFLFSNMDVMLLMAGGSGISVMTRIIQEYIRNNDKMSGKTVILLFFVQYPEDVIWRKVWRDLAKKYAWFNFSFSLTRSHIPSTDSDFEELEDKTKQLRKENDIRKGSVAVGKSKPGEKKKEGNNLQNPAAADSRELYGYPEKAKLEDIFKGIGGASEAEKHKAIICGPYGFNQCCKGALMEFGKHREEDTYYFAA